MRKLFTRWLHPSDKDLILWLDAELSPRRAGQVARHLDRCEKCRCRMDDLDRVQHLFRKPEVRPGFARDFETRLSGMRYEPHAAPSRLHRAAWVLLFSGACLGVAAGLPDDAAHLRASALEVWNAVFNPGRIDSPVLGLRVPPPVIATTAAVSVPPRHAVTRVAKLPGRPSLLERETAEIDARYALHRVRACMGEQIEYSEDGSGYVSIRALVDTDARKQELQQALEGIPSLHTRIRTVQESMNEVSAGSFREKLSTATPQLSHSTLVIPGNVPRERFLDISRDAVADSGLCMQHAWAMRRLSDGYPQARVALLPPESRRKLTAMLNDHATEWRQVLASLQDRVAPILDAQRLAPASTPLASANTLFAQAEELDRLTRGLFSEYNGPPIDVAAAVPTLNSLLAQIQATLERQKPVH